MAFGNKGVSRLAVVMQRRMKTTGKAPEAADFGTILADGSLLTDSFPIPIPAGRYLTGRGLCIGPAGSELARTSGGDSVKVPETLRSVGPGDRVLVNWVKNSAVVVDIVKG